MINKKNTYKYLLIVLMFSFVSCKTQKGVVETVKTTANSDQFQNAEEVKFQYFYVEGTKELMLGNFSVAREMFETCLDIKPKSSASYFHLAKIYFNAGDILQAIIFAKTAVDENPSNIWYKIYLVKLHNSVENYEASSKILTGLIEEYPTNKNLYFDLSELYVYQKDYNEAIRVLEDLEKTQKNNEISDIKIQIYYMMLDYNSILDELEILININPEEIKYHGMLAEIYTRQGKFEQAQKAYEKLNLIAPDDGKSQISAVFFYLNIENYTKALEIQTKAYFNKSARLEAKIQLFLKVAELENEVYNEQAIFDFLNILVETHPESTEVKELNLNYLLEREDKEAARNQLLEILESDKSNFQLWRQLLVLDTEMQQNSQIIEDANNALVYYPNQPIIYYFLGFAHNKLKNYEEAVSNLETSLSYIIDNYQFEQDVLLLLAESYYKNSQLEKSFTTFDKILKTNPSNSLALNNYSFYLSLEKQQLEKAVSMSILANELVIDNANFLDTYAWALFQSKNYIKALEIIEQAIAHGGKKSAIITEHYGDILSILKQKDKALEQWKLAKTLGSKSKTLEEKISLKKYIE